MASDPRTHSRRRAPWWTWVLLAIPYVALCFPSIYNRATPALGGFPFFYWYQLAWVILASTLLWIVYLQLKSE
jgi:hypothetical protein